MFLSGSSLEHKISSSIHGQKKPTPHFVKEQKHSSKVTISNGGWIWHWHNILWNASIPWQLGL